MKRTRKAGWILSINGWVIKFATSKHGRPKTISPTHISSLTPHQAIIPNFLTCPSIKTIQPLIIDRSNSDLRKRVMSESLRMIRWSNDQKVFQFVMFNLFKGENLFTKWLILITTQKGNKYNKINNQTPLPLFTVLAWPPELPHDFLERLWVFFLHDPDGFLNLQFLAMVAGGGASTSYYLGGNSWIKAKCHGNR